MPYRSNYGTRIGIVIMSKHNEYDHEDTTIYLSQLGWRSEGRTCINLGASYKHNRRPVFDYVRGSKTKSARPAYEEDHIGVVMSEKDIRNVSNINVRVCG